ncbi:MAG TPA: hypothetical protein VFN73_04145 [Propionibacteriaceae bacterium]|nr:hypothetical protein [Propionibacteriaceae bacterium]
MPGASALKYSAVVLMTLFALLGGLFAAGYAIADLSGRAAALLIAAYAVPAVGLSVLAIIRPAVLGPVLVGLSVVVIVFNDIDAAARLIPRDTYGPVGVVAVLMLAAAIGFLGLHRPLLAGVLLVALAIGQAVAAVAGRDVAGGEPLGAVFSGSTGIVVIPLLVIGGLFLLAGRPPTHPASVAPAH